MHRTSPTASVAAPTPLLALLLVACGAAAPASNGSGSGSGERFPIQLDRAMHVGQRIAYTSHTTQREHTVTTFGGQVVDTTDAMTVLAFDGTFEVLAVDEAGHAVDLHYDVRSFTRDQGQGPMPVLRPGQVLRVHTAATEAEQSLLVDAARVSEELADTIGEAVTLHRGADDDDRMFGSATPRAVGEQWPVDVASLAASLVGRSPMQLDPSHLHGHGEIVQRLEVEGVDGLAILTAIDGDRVQLTGLASGASVREGRVAMRFGGFFPLDPSMPRLRSRAELHAELSMRMSTPRGDADVVLAMMTTTERTFGPL